MKTTYYGYIPTPKHEQLKWEYDWFDYSIATERVRDTRPFMTRKTIPKGCCCIRDVVKCRYYNDTSAIIRCELLGADSKEYPCLRTAIKICNEPDRNIITHHVEIFE